MLASFEAQDRADFDKAVAKTLKILHALMPKTTNNSQITSSSKSPATPLDIASTISQHPLIKMEFLFDSKKVKIQSIIDDAQLSQQQALRSKFDEDIFVLIIPNRCIELKVFMLENTMWHIPCINHPPPIYIPLWHQWAGLSL